MEHRRKFYHVGYADYDKDYRERISFLPPESCIEAWRADYSELLMHFVYGNKLTFDELLERVGELNKIGFVSPARRYEAPVCCTTVENVI